MLMTESFDLQLDDLLQRICAKLQISQTQHRLAEDRYTTIGDWLERDGSALAGAKPNIFPQGSLRIGTTVRPLHQQEYDLDLVCELEIDWRRVANPVALLGLVEARLRQHDTYRAMLERKNRCIRVTYANDFHLDILPACPDPASGPGCIVVPDREAREWKASNPRGFAAWFDSRANLFGIRLLERMEPLPDQESAAVKAPLKLAVQLLKRWRDIAYAKVPDAAPISIVLTTLAGCYYSGQTSVNQSLTDILDSIVAALPPRGQRLVVSNPTNPREDLSESWDEDPRAYKAFVAGILSLQTTWQQLNIQRGIQTISATLESLFGEDPTRSAIREQAQLLEKARVGQRLGVHKSSGILGGMTAASMAPVRLNTFYGE